MVCLQDLSYSESHVVLENNSKPHATLSADGQCIFKTFHRKLKQMSPLPPPPLFFYRGLHFTPPSNQAPQKPLSISISWLLQRRAQHPPPHRQHSRTVPPRTVWGRGGASPLLSHPLPWPSPCHLLPLHLWTAGVAWRAWPSFIFILLHMFGHRCLPTTLRHSLSGPSPGRA